MRPRAAPTLLATVAALAPARIVKRLDGAPRAAEAWDWQGNVVTTDGGEKVTLTPDEGWVRELHQLTCSCLLSPRCFHVLAVAAALEVGTETEPPATESPAVKPVIRAPTALVAVNAGQRAVGTLALQLLDEWLRQGSSGAGAVLQGELLRVAHEARLEGAHRLGGAALRIVRATRALRAEQPEFSSAALVDDLRDLAQAARLLAVRSELHEVDVGVARRDYAPIGNLRLHGLACEPVISRGGSAGVASYVCDDRGTIYTLSDVMPAAPSRARGAYELPVIMGDTSVSHRELTRAGLFVQEATASPDLRLGAGRQVKAVRASGWASYDEPACRALFALPLAAQLDRAFAAFRGESALRPRSASLLLVKAKVLGADGDALAVVVDGTALRLTAADEHPSLPYRDNLRLLGELPGRELWVIAHVAPERPLTLGAIAVGATGDALALPEAMGGRVNLGLDVITRAQLVAPVRSAAPVRVDAGVDPLAPLRRRLAALALGGVRSLPPEAQGRIELDRSQLVSSLMPGAADCLAALARACRATSSKATGPRLSDAFLAATTYERAATLHLQRVTFCSGAR